MQSKIHFYSLAETIEKSLSDFFFGYKQTGNELRIKLFLVLGATCFILGNALTEILPLYTTNYQ